MNVADTRTGKYTAAIEKRLGGRTRYRRYRCPACKYAKNTYEIDSDLLKRILSVLEAGAKLLGRV